MIPIDAVRDTLTNIGILAYIGLLVWLYFRSDSERR